MESGVRGKRHRVVGGRREADRYWENDELFYCIDLGPADACMPFTKKTFEDCLVRLLMSSEWEDSPSQTEIIVAEFC